MSQNLQNFVKFQKFQLENLVDFEKCCKTHIFLQKSEPIQPKTSNILPKFCQPTEFCRSFANREVLHLDLPDGLHAELLHVQDLDVLDGGLRERRGHTWELDLGCKKGFG